MRILFTCCLLILGVITQAQQQPRLVLPVGHTGNLGTIVMSHDRKYMTTYNFQGPIVIWQVDGAKLIKTYYPLVKGQIKKVLFTSDNSKLVIDILMQGVFVYDISSGKSTRLLKVKDFLCTDLDIDIDYSSNTLLVCHGKKYIFYDLSDFNIKKQIKSKYGCNQIHYFNQNYLVTSSSAVNNPYYFVWDTELNELLFKIKWKEIDPFGMSLQFGFNQQILFLSKKKMIIVSYDNLDLGIWDIEKKSEVKRLPIPHQSYSLLMDFDESESFFVTTASDKLLNVWDADSFEILNQEELDFKVSSLYINSRNQIKYTIDNFVYEIDLKFNKNEFSSPFLIKTLPQKIIGDFIHYYDDKNIYLTEKSKNIYLYQDTGNRLIDSFVSNTVLPMVVNGNNDGSLLMFTDKEIVNFNYYDNKITNTGLYNAKDKIIHCSQLDSLLVMTKNDSLVYLYESNKLLRIIRPQHSFLESKRDPNESLDRLSYYSKYESGEDTSGFWNNKKNHLFPISSYFSPKCSKIITNLSSEGYSDNIETQIFDFNSGDFIKSLRLKNIFFSISPQENLIASVNTYNLNGKEYLDSSLNIFDINKKIEIRYGIGKKGVIKGIKFVNNSNKIIALTFEGFIVVINAEDGSFISKKIDDLFGWIDIYINPSDRYVVLSNDRESRIYETDLKDKFEFKGKISGSLFPTQPPNAKFVFFTNGGRIDVYNQSDLSFMYSLASHTESIKNITLTKNGCIVTQSSDMSTKIWDAATGKQLYTRLQLKNGDWLVYDEDFHYDGSPGARELLYFVCGLEVVELSQMKDALYVPGLAEKIMTGQTINYKKLTDLDICGALPLIEGISKNDKGYHYKITPRKYPLERLELQVNNKNVITILPQRLVKTGNDFYLYLTEQEVSRHFFSGQSNRIKLIGVVKDGNTEITTRGLELTSVESTDKTDNPPNLYAIMVGVNDYKDDRLHLNFPSKDAFALGKSLEQSAKKLLGEEHVFVYNVNTDFKNNQIKVITTPEKEGVRKVLEEIGKKSKPEDIVMIFFAGHGVMQGATDKKFTFLTAEASKDNPVGISTNDLKSWLSPEGPNKMLANKCILIFDACNSGQATKEMAVLARSDDESNRIRQVEDLKDKSGMFILAASAPNQSAYELPQYQQGLLTYCLLSTLKNDPGILDDNKYLNVQKWFLQTEVLLKNTMENLGLDQKAQPFGTANIKIGLVDDGVKNSIQLAKEKPAVLCIGAEDKSSDEDGLRLKDKLNAKLMEITSRGIDAPIIYIEKETNNANAIKLKYEIQSGTLKCDIIFLKNQKKYNQETVVGKQPDLDGLIDLIIGVVEKSIQ